MTMRWRRGCVLILLATVSGVRAGDLDPPGPPGSAVSRMKTLNEIEPRSLIASVPVTITNSGSYSLVGNLTATGDTSGITIDADDVTLDLAGFVLIGNTNSYSGITLGSRTNRNITIRNGVVRGWGYSGLSLYDGLNCRVENVTAFDNASRGASGIYVGEEWTIVNCYAFGNHGPGIVVGNHSRAWNCKARQNEGNGFHFGTGSVLRDCVAVENEGYGFFGTTLSKVVDCVAIDNTSDGIYVGPNSIAEGNLCGQNGGYGMSMGAGSFVARNLVSLNQGGGISGGSGCRVARNLVNGNTGVGVSAGYGTRVEGNQATENQVGFVSGNGAFGSLFVGNSAYGNATNYITTVSANFGNIATTNELSPSTNFWFSNPWGNFDLED